MLDFVGAVRSLRVDFRHALTGDVSGVLHGDSHGDGVAVHLHLIERLLEGGVGKAVAERILYFIRVLPTGSAIGSAGRTRGISLAHDGVRVTGFIVTISNVDVFRLEGHVIGIFRRTDLLMHVVQVQERRGVGAGVHNGRCGQGARGIGVDQLAGRVHGTAQDFRYAGKALVSGEANVQDRVRVRLDLVHFHLVRAV